MSMKYVRVFRLCDGAVILPSQFVDVPIPQEYEFLKPLTKLGMRFDEPAVSKILDWLVK